MSSFSFKKSLYSINKCSENSFSLTVSEYEGLLPDITALPEYLTIPILIINSTTSGVKISDNIFDNILQPLFNKLNINFIYVQTINQSSIKETAELLNTKYENINTVIIMGGDTSVSEFVNFLPKKDVSKRLNLFIIPTGTGNALSLSSAIPNEAPIPNSITAIFKGSLKPLSSFTVSFPKNSIGLPGNKVSWYCIAVASWGLHASLVADSDSVELRKYGISRFKKAAELNLTERNQIYHGSMSFLEDSGDTPISYLLFSLVSQIEKGYIISPDSIFPDGNLYAIIIPAITNSEVSEVVMLPYQQGKHIQDSRVNYQNIRNSCTVNIFPFKQGLKSSTDEYNGDVQIYGRWCVDGVVVTVPETGGQVTIGTSTKLLPSGWNLFLGV